MTECVTLFISAVNVKKLASFKPRTWSRIYMKAELGNCMRTSTKNRFKTEYSTRKRERERERERA